MHGDGTLRGQPSVVHDHLRTFRALPPCAFAFEARYICFLRTPMTRWGVRLVDFQRVPSPDLAAAGSCVWSSVGCQSHRCARRTTGTALTSSPRLGRYTINTAVRSIYSIELFTVFRAVFCSIVVWYYIVSCMVTLSS